MEYNLVGDEGMEASRFAFNTSVRACTTFMVIIKCSFNKYESCALTGMVNMSARAPMS